MCQNISICFSADPSSPPRVINRGRCLPSYHSEAFLTLLSLPVKVFQGYDNDDDLQHSITPVCIPATMVWLFWAIMIQMISASPVHIGN